MMARQYLLKKGKASLKDRFFYSKMYHSPADFPLTVDLRSGCSPIVDQGQQGSCTANAIGCGLLEYLQLKKLGTYTRMSRSFLYWEERSIEGNTNEDAGAYIVDGMKVANTIGCAPDTDMPYHEHDFMTPPSPRAITDAVNYKVAEYHKIADTNMLKAALAEGLPVVIGMDVYASFESTTVARTGKVLLPKKKEQNLGGHAVLVVGYKKIGRTLYYIVRNSWGEGWGDKGYFYLPESYFTKGYVSDMWTATLAS